VDSLIKNYKYNMSRMANMVPPGGLKGLPNNFFINCIVDEMALKERLGREEVSCDVCIRDDLGVLTAVCSCVITVMNLTSTSKSIKATT